MAVNSRTTLFDGVSVGANQTSAVANVSEDFMICIHAQTTGNPNGDLIFEVSNGLVTGADGLPSIWEELDRRTFLAADTQMWLDKEIPYTHVRMRWVDNGGNGSLSAVLTGKGER